MTVAAPRLSPLYEVKLIADGKQHFYQIGNDEKWLPGVTTALSMINKPALVQWASNTACENIKEELLKYPDTVLSKELIEKICLEGKNIYKKKAQDAADIGTKVHRAVDAIIKGESPAIEDDIKPGVDGFLAWKAQNSIQIELGDSKLGSRLFGYGGSLDFVSFDSEGPIIWDIKTTKKRRDRDHGIYPEAAMQLAAYSVAFKETFGLEVKKVYALWLNKEKPEFKAVKISNINACFEGFLAALKLYQLQKFEMFDEQPKI